ncbi:MAG: hypothetical protein II877_04750 [Synergistaceae bacterium]|nr:hypothetical protein [Synergistaceae bacterium]
MTELSETIELMQSEDYRERFKAEYWQVRIRLSKLGGMIKKYEAGTLEFEPKCSIEILKRQFITMYEYLFVLEERARIEGIDLNGGRTQ